ncbi:hypothetical protein ACFWXO_13730 [Kitasatospora sp. NPDC059088]|uniref:hypothetical protein n=1 Tax=Kitasatospora sp. NPDC059088 TaxID=3346722 RepID=UPI00369BFDF9
MSYDLTPLEGSPADREVRIGWDGPLSSYFLQVLDYPSDPDAEEEVVELVWMGAAPFEHPEPDDLLEVARQFAEVPDDLASRLAADKASGTSTFAGRVGTHLVGESTLAEVTSPEQAAQIFTALGQTARD